MNQFEIGDGGRVKMAAGSVDLYYDAAQPLAGGEVSGAYEAHENFIRLRDNPPAELKAAYFPSVGIELKQRLRGAGLYRYLRMDQGPGGNFMAFTVDDTHGLQQSYDLATAVPHALLEESIKMQIRPNSELGAVALSVTTAYSQGNLGETFGLMNHFKEIAQKEDVKLPETNVGSRNGFFLINPVETGNAKLSADTRPAVHEALCTARSLAAATRHHIKAGRSLDEAVRLARQSPVDSDRPDDLLYFQPDCFVDTCGNVSVERINFPDVGFFLTEIDSGNNIPLQQVRTIVSGLSQRVADAALGAIETGHVTLVIKDEAVERATDLLEVNESRALVKLLQGVGFSVAVIGLSAHDTLKPDTTALILNPNIASEEYANFCERCVLEDLAVYPDPLLKIFEQEATTMQTFCVSGTHLNTLLSLLKPKEITEQNAAKIHDRLNSMLDKGGVPRSTDILYAFLPNQKAPLPLFRHSLHSFMQLYNAVERAKREGTAVECICLRSVPFNRDTAVFGNGHGPRLAAFRPMYIRSKS